MLDTYKKVVRVLTIPGLNLTTPVECMECIHRTQRKFCEIWAFPEYHWRMGTGCPDYQKVSESPVIVDT